MQCPQCQAQIPDGSQFCTVCGARLNAAQPPAIYQPPPVAPTPGPDLIYPQAGRPEPWAMFAFSGCCIAGLGQIILGQTGKGLVIMLITAILLPMTGFTITVLLFPMWGVDAYLLAQKLKQGRPIGKWEWF